MMQSELLSVMLTDFRKRLEAEAGVKANAIDASVASVLIDLCESLGFSESLTRRVVGIDAYTAVCGDASPLDVLPDGYMGVLRDASKTIQ